MNKSTKIFLSLGLILLILGGILFTVTMSKLNWDFNALDTNKYLTSTHEITESFDKISIDVDTADVSIIKTQEQTPKVVCFEREVQIHNVSVENGTLIITSPQTDWKNFIAFFNFKSPSITLYLPKADYSDLIIESNSADLFLAKELTFNNVLTNTDTGDVKVNSNVKENLKVTTDTGDIDVYDICAYNVELSVRTGDIEINKLSCNDLTVRVTTGDSELNDVQCKNLISTGDTGDLELVNVIASGKFTIERDTGDVEILSSDASEIQVTTDTGDVKMTLLSSKVFAIDTDTGRKRIPISTEGGLCQVTTDTGDIEIYIKE